MTNFRSYLAALLVTVSGGVIAATAQPLPEETPVSTPSPVDIPAEVARARAMLVDGAPADDIAAGLQIWADAAAAGNLDAVQFLGTTYQFGRYGQPVDVVRATEYFQQGIDAGHVPAMVSLGDIHRAAGDLASAKALYEQGVAAGGILANRQLAGLLLRSGTGFQDGERAVALLEEAVAKKSYAATVELANVYRNGAGGIPRDMNKAIAMLEPLAESGYRGALNSLGDILRFGLGGSTADPTRAFALFEQAYAQNDPGAGRKLADMLLRGQGAEVDVVRATDILEPMVEAGNGAARMILADYLSRQTDPADIGRAAELYSASAAEGDVNAMRRLGDLASRGPVPTRDYAAAAEFYGLAAALNNNVARRDLAALLINGRAGLPADPERAIALWDDAIAAGDTTAAITLGTYFSAASRLDRDRALAAFSMAIENGDSAAQVAMGVALSSGLFGIERRPEGVGMLKDAAESGIANGRLEYARVMARGFVDGTTRAGLLAVLEPEIEANNRNAIRYLVQLYRDGSGTRFTRDRDAALALISQKEDVLGVEVTALERLYVRAAQLAPLAELTGYYDALNDSSRAGSVRQLFNLNKNAYVYVVQAELNRRGYFDGTFSGTLTRGTINSIVDFCSANGIGEVCNRGPLTRDAANAISSQFAANLPAAI